ncbi:MAG TPA: MBL fold metallo-hydrolase [Flavobacteriales bacterium]|nr:MBL fold metallo-hydrolase [Flavobacteriales bacterium]HRE97142.1 MBL fold metallo-hydrolase [Flavobacteriales bacterium]HRJ37282.1 MBL fold metallo-hydrolase [Flavobacteriales bacterium]
MKIEQIYTGCLAEAAYYIESNGEAAIIDPLREVEPYIKKAKENNATIKYVFETHFHADFVSGHVDLAAKTGAAIVYGPTKMETGFKAHIAHDGELFRIGNISIELIHTPGHTMESSCYLLRDENGKETAIFTGDTLFIGDVGRPDLAQHVISDLTEDKLAGHLFDSLRNKIMPLNDDIVVYPGHGAGSACGKNMSKETYDTLGNQKKVNYALNPALSKEEFKKQLLTGLTPPPGYFPQNVVLNIKGYDSFDKVMDRGMRALNPVEFEVAANETGALIIDTRRAEEFHKGFIPNAVNIGIDGSFAVWVGTLVPDVKQPLLLIIEEGREEEVITRLSRVGYDQPLGYLKGGIAEWIKAAKETDTITSVSADEFAVAYKKGNANILDVRKASEYFSEHIVEAENAPLDYINDSMLKVDKNKSYYVHCAGGYRSMTFVSILQARGYRNLINVAGGFSAIKATGKFRISDYVCPTTML